MLTLNESIIQLVRISAIVFALIHLLAGFVLIRQMSRMNNIIRTQNRGCLTIMGWTYGLLLMAVLGLIIFLPIQ
jgi:choline-glycine betaine transporter